MENILSRQKQMPFNPFRSTKSHTFSQDAHSKILIERLISHELLTGLIDHVRKQEWLAVGHNGRAGQPFEQVGNYRVSTYSEDLSQILWAAIKPFLPEIRHMTPFTPTDHDDHPMWSPCGVNPLFRFIRYTGGGELVAHYDETFIKSDDERSLMSLILYLTTNSRGATRFLFDPQGIVPMSKMDFSDWKRPGMISEVTSKVYPTAGNALIFDHRILHDSEPMPPLEMLDDEEKIIIRSDIMFKKVPVNNS